MATDFRITTPVCYLMREMSGNKKPLLDLRWGMLFMPGISVIGYGNEFRVYQLAIHH